MSTIKTITSSLTAVALVSGIGLAWAQTSDQNQPTDPMQAATATPISEQTPADPNAAPQTDTTLTQQQTEPATPPADTTAPMPQDSMAAQPQQPATTMDSAIQPTPADPVDEPAPRADRN